MIETVAVGSVWDTHAGNLWRVEELLPDERVRVRCVNNGKPADHTWIWALQSLTHGTKVED